MPKLSDTHLVILSAAGQRKNRLVLPLPEKLKGGAAAKVINSLLAKGMIEEVEAQPGHPVWREREDGMRLTLVATDAAFAPLGIAEPDTGEEQPNGPTHAASEPATGGEEPVSETAAPAGAEAAPTPATTKGRTPRSDSKQAQLIAMLERPEGASLDEIVAATRWQKHTVRGAIAALRKKLGLDVTSEKVEGRGRVYRIA